MRVPYRWFALLILLCAISVSGVYAVALPEAGALPHTKEYIAELINQLRDPDTEMCVEAVRTLGQLRAIESKDALLALFKDKRSVVRTAAVLSLGLLGDPDCIEPIKTMAGDPETSVRINVVNALSYFDDERSFAALQGLLADADASVRGEAARALTSYGDIRANEAIVPLLHDESWMVRVMALQYLHTCGLSEQQEELIAMTRDSSANIRELALSLLKDNLPLQTIVDALQDQDSIVREAAAEILAKQQNAQALEILLAMAASAQDGERIRAVIALSAYSDQRVTLAYSNLANQRTGSPVLKRLVYRGLAEIGDEFALKVLTDHLNNSDEATKCRILRELGYGSNPACVKLLVSYLDNPSPKVRSSALLGVSHSRSEHPILTEAVRGRLAVEKESDVKRTLIEVLYKIKDPLTGEFLIEAAHDDDPRIRLAAYRALGENKVTAAVDVLLAALTNGKEDERKEAAIALGKIGDRKALEPLLNATEDPTPIVRLGCAIALGNFRDDRVRTQLMKLVQDADKQVLLQALVALGKQDSVETYKILVAALRNADRDIRLHAVNGIAYSTSESIIGDLISALERETRVTVYNRIIEVLEAKTGKQFGNDNEKWLQWFQEKTHE